MEDRTKLPTTDELRATLKPCGSKAGRNDYSRSQMLTCADVEVIRIALNALDEQQKRASMPAEVEVKKLRSLVKLADTFLADPSTYWAGHGKNLWERAKKEAAFDGANVEFNTDKVADVDCG